MSLGLLFLLTILLSPIPVAVWTAIDAYQRRMLAPVWALAVLILLPFVLPIYLAVRTLKPGETREGGRGWNVLKNFALCWTLLVALFSAVAAVIPTLSARLGPAETITALFIAFLMYTAIWIGPMLVALIVGAFVRKSGTVERGPTGRLLTRNLAL